MDRYRPWLLLLACCLIFVGCGNFEEDDGQLLQGLAPNGLGNEPGLEMSGLGTSPFGESSGLGTSAAHESGLGTEAAGGLSGLESTGTDYTSVCQNADSLGCLVEDGEEITVQECVFWVSIANNFHPKDAWIACLAGAHSCLAIQLCSDQYEVHDDDDYDYDEEAVVDSPDVDCQQVCEEALSRFESTPEVMDECVDNCEAD